MKKASAKKINHSFNAPIATKFSSVINMQSNQSANYGYGKCSTKDITREGSKDISMDYSKENRVHDNPKVESQHQKSIKIGYNFSHKQHHKLLPKLLECS